MNVALLTPIVPAAPPQILRLKLEGIGPEITSVTVTIIRVGELRDDWIFGTSAKLDFGDRIECAIPLDSLAPGLYQIAEIGPDRGDTRVMRAGLPPTKRNDLYFCVDGGASRDVNPDQWASEIYAKRTEHRSAQLATEAAAQGSGEQYRAVVFFMGVPLDYPQHLKGCTISPLPRGMGSASLNEVVSLHLYESLGVVANFPQQADFDFRLNNSLFAIHIANLLAKGMDDALTHVLNFSADIAALIGTERGEKPTRCAVYLANKDGFSLFPITESYRGNLAPPMFRNQQADLLERYLPVLSRSRRARLDLDLYAQAMADRDHGFQYFRHWAVLEMIAFRHVTSSATKLLYPDGSNVLAKDGKPRTSKGNSDRVYQYLFGAGVSLQQMMWKAPDGRDLTMQGTTTLAASSTTEIMTLWMAVRAAYRIRNAVAHDGYFEPDTGSADTELASASHMYSAGPFLLGFLALETKNAVFRELELTLASY